MKGMDAVERARAVELLGAFNDEMTRVVDSVFGTQWAEIEEIIAMVALMRNRAMTTRSLAEVSGLDRRAISRLVARLSSEGTIETRSAPQDRRSVQVALTRQGQRQAVALRSLIGEFFTRSRSIADEISRGLGSRGGRSGSKSATDSLDLLRRVCDAGASLVRAMPSQARQGSLAARQRAALVLIANSGGLRPSELTLPLDVSRAGATYIIDQLCTKGFVSRSRGLLPGDRRAVVLQITAEGGDALRAVANAIEDQRESLSALFAEVAAWDSR